MGLRELWGGGCSIAGLHWWLHNRMNLLKLDLCTYNGWGFMPCKLHRDAAIRKITGALNAPLTGQYRENSPCTFQMWFYLLEKGLDFS